MECGDQMAFTANGEKIDIWSEKSIHSSDELVNFWPVEIPKTKIEHLIWKRKSFQLCIGVLLDPIEMTIIALSERI